jgi:uncharacterized protein (DUF169 family)
MAEKNAPVEVLWRKNAEKIQKYKPDNDISMCQFVM